jgi:hypothetical protein
MEPHAMTASRFPDAPPQIAALPVESRGYPVPYFVSLVDGEADFRVVDPRKITKADREGLCWICGKKLGGLLCFPVGPMCTVNRVSPEPPSHLSCARFAVCACPFLSKPMAKRRPIKGGTSPTAGIMIERNPGVIALWLTRSYRTERDMAHQRGGVLFRLGPPVRVEWWAEGRHATRAEVKESIRTGLPRLAEMAELDGPEGTVFLRQSLERAMRWIPV